jgi:hypothetical protein
LTGVGLWPAAHERYSARVCPYVGTVVSRKK